MRAAEKESRVNVRWRGPTFHSQSGPPPPPAKPCRDDAKMRRTDVAARPFLSFQSLAHSASLALSSPWAALVLFPRPSDVGRTKRA